MGFEGGPLVLLGFLCPASGGTECVIGSMESSIFSPQSACGNLPLFLEGRDSVFVFVPLSPSYRPHSNPSAKQSTLPMGVFSKCLLVALSTTCWTLKGALGNRREFCLCLRSRGVRGGFLLLGESLLERRGQRCLDLILQIGRLPASSLFLILISR